METEYLKFKCPQCGGTTIEAVQQEAQVTQNIALERKAHASDDVNFQWRGEPLIAGDDIYIERFQCADCGFILNCDGDYESLYDYLMELPENRQAERSEKELTEIADAVEQLCDEHAMYDNMCKKYGKNSPQVMDRLRSFYHSRNFLYSLIGGCESLMKNLERIDVDDGD